ncbi:MAG: LA_3751/LA_3752 family putative glycosyltransferase [Phormidesmis sp.]
MPVKRHATPTYTSRSWLPVLVISAGIALTSWIQLFTQNGVFYSEDSGLKALVARQLAQQIRSGSFPLDIALNLPATDWINSLWQDGLYPFTPPDVYAIGSQYFIASPFTFPLLNAPLYALIGDRGLYVIPLVSLWVLWLRFWQIGIRARWGTTSLCLSLITLIFASPLTLYGGMHQAHTLAVAIAFWGISSLIFPTGGWLSRFSVFCSGILIGLSVWLQPEFLYLVAAVSLLAIIGWLFPKWRLAPRFTSIKAFILIGSMFCVVGLFLTINYAIYGHPVGIQSPSAPFNTPFSALGTANFTDPPQMLSKLQQYFPIVWVASIVAFFSPELRRATVKVNPSKSSPLKGKRGQKKQSRYFERLGIRKTADSAIIPGRFALCLSLLFTLAVVLFVPTDADKSLWGPQHFLILIPLLSLVLAEQLKPNFFRTWGRQLVIVGAAIAFLFGSYLNTVQGAFLSNTSNSRIPLQANYEASIGAIATFQENPTQWIAVSQSSVAQQLWNALPNKTFFHTETIDQVKQLASELLNQNEREFLYACAPNLNCLVSQITGNDLNLPEGTHTLNMSFVGDYGPYPTYKVEIAELAEQNTEPVETSQPEEAQPEEAQSEESQPEQNQPEESQSEEDQLENADPIEAEAEA